MPFQDDTGIDYDSRRGPLLGAVAAFAAQIERMVVINLTWSVHLVPSWLALANAEWPTALRAAAVAYTGVALVPATGLLYGLATEASQHTYLNLDLARETLRRLALPSFLTLLPLFSLFGLVTVGIGAVGGDPAFLLPETLLRLAVFLLLVCAHFWGPLFVRDPSQNAAQLLWRSGLMVWRYPLPTLLLSGAVALVIFFSLISVAGVFLAGPVLIALLQVEMTHYLRRRRTA
jgi:hypothetical protein